MNKNYDYVEYGMILGCLVLIGIWFKFGKQMIKDVDHNGFDYLYI